MRRLDSAPSKSLPPFVDRSPFQPTRSVDADAAGSVMVGAEAPTSTPSRKVSSVLGKAEGA
jgi:hypothetical protein